MSRSFSSVNRRKFSSIGEGPITCGKIFAAASAQEIEMAAADARVPLKLLDLREAGLETLYAAPLALIRPDQFVAWRGADADAGALMRTISGNTHIRSTPQDFAAINDRHNQGLGRAAS